MKRRLGIVLIAVGAVLLSGALGLYLYNSHIQHRAGKSTAAVMPRLVEAIYDRAEDLSDSSNGAEEMRIVPAIYKSQMPVAEVDGNSYIGFVHIPTLNLDLPVMAGWSYPKLEVSPCRFSGDMYTGDLVVMAHNYRQHFGSLGDLRQGDAVSFTDMDGATLEYRVVAIDILEPNAVEDLIAGEYDLTLFTCTYGGKSRITVRCDRI